MNNALPCPTTILIVEDCAEILELLEMALGAMGHTLLRCSGVEEALKVWEERGAEIDLLVTDLRLGESGSGLDLAERFLSVNPSLKVIAMSGCCRTKELSLAGRKIELLQKPFALQDIADRVERLLATPAKLSH